MLKRKMSRRLEEWKAAPERTAFIMLGAHRTGKTSTIRNFARNGYAALIELNFMENPDGAALLAGASSVDELDSRLAQVTGRSIEPGTLVFFDEAQQLGQEAILLAKLLLEDERIDVVLSSSLLGTPLEGGGLFSDDAIRFDRMYPLDFEEFCWAIGVPDSEIAEVYRCYAAGQPLDEALHERLMLAFRQYIVVGGMPESVQLFLDSDRNIEAARQRNSEIMDEQRYDTYARMPARKTRSRSIFDDISAQISKLAKRLSERLEAREAGGDTGSTAERARDERAEGQPAVAGDEQPAVAGDAGGGEQPAVTDAATGKQARSGYSWMVETGFTLTASLALEPRHPLRSNEPSRKKTKLYSCDSGLLISRYSPSVARQAIADEGDASSLLVYAYENVMAQQLASAGFPLFYYNGRKGKIDFLIEDGSGSVVPLEVMAGDDYKEHLALDDLLDNESDGIDRAYVLSEHNVSAGERGGKPIYYLPLYMSMCFEDEREDGASDLHLEEVEG